MRLIRFQSYRGSHRLTSRKVIGFLLLGACIAVVLRVQSAMAQTCASQPLTIGYRDFNYNGGNVVSEVTLSNPESKLWWNDGYWWASLWVPNASTYRIHRFDLANQCWMDTGTNLDDRAKSLADVLWDGQHLYVASHFWVINGANTTPTNSGRLYRYSYNAVTKTYSLDAGFPVNVNSSTSETLVLTKEATGKLWVTWTQEGKVMVNRTVGDDLTWGTPFVLPVQGNDLDLDDISSIIALGNDKIGILWSNQAATDKKMYFAVHLNSKPDTEWEPREEALADPTLGNMADDHISLTCNSNTGALVAVTKTGLNAATLPLIYLLKRDANGVWSRHVVGKVQDNHTRPIVLINSDTDSVYVIAKAKTTPIKIYIKRAHLSNPQFPAGLGATFIASVPDTNINNPTSTKQCLNATTGLLVLASDRTTKYYVHNYLSLSAGNNPPSITSFTPSSGPVGTSVTITGTDFTGVTNVTFNGTAATSYTVDSAMQIRATVPTGATTGKISITNASGTGMSATDFIVNVPPTITEFTPGSGPVGTSVTITGMNFTGVTNVAFNGTAAMSYTVGTATQIRATVPSEATTGKISVTNADGTGLSATDFVVILPPTITSFSPASGPVGTEVTITGTNFNGTTSVTFNGTTATFTVDSDMQIRANVPTGVPQGGSKIGVSNSAGSALSTTDFTVTDPPQIFLFTPLYDAYVRFASPTNNYGTSTTLRVRAISGDSLRTYFKFNVTGLSGTVQSAKLRLYVTDAGNDGGAVYVVSNNYQGNTTPWTENGLKWNNAPLISGTALSLAGAVSLNSWIELEVTPAVFGNGTYSFGMKNSSSDVVFYSSKENTHVPELVIQTDSSPPSAPTITSFTPTSGDAGSEVTISGTNLGGATQVAFNGTAATTFTVDSQTQIRAAVPAAATTGKISVTTAGGTAMSTNDFSVLHLPHITSFTPTSGPMSTEVTITGTNFTGTTSVAFNGTVATFISDSATQIRATVPAGATTGKISVTNADGTGSSATDFIVTAPPAITSFSPTSGPVGTEVTITGTNLNGTTSVTFNGTAATSFTVNSNTQIRAIVPSGATTGKIGLSNSAGSALSATDFTVTALPLIFMPLHDAYVKSSTPTSNYGTVATLRQRVTSSETLRTYLKFDVSGISGPVQSAKLRFYVTDGSNNGGAVYVVSNDYAGTTTPWTESGLNWNNAPSLSGTPLSSLGGVSTGIWVEFDVTSAIAGNGSYSFGLKNTSSDAVYFGSKENSNKSQLVIQLGASALAASKMMITDEIVALPGQFSLFPNYPNPFNAQTAIEYALPQESKVRLRIYNTLGHLIRTVVDETQSPGYKRAVWDGKNDSGVRVSSGIYFYQLEAGFQKFTRKMILQQ
jgi:hypothetical protein